MVFLFSHYFLLSGFNKYLNGVKFWLWSQKGPFLHLLRGNCSKFNLIMKLLDDTLAGITTTC